jgi:hypothetical protein
MSVGKRAYNLMRAYVGREWERVQGLDRELARQELDSPPAVPKAPPPPAEDPKAVARRVLGVPAEANYEEIQRAYDRLRKRSDPANFPDHSSEQSQARDLLKRVEWAYAQLTNDMPTTEKRFRTLEVE